MNRRAILVAWATAACAGCAQRGDPAFTDYTWIFSVDGSWTVQAPFEGNGARRFRYLTLARRGDAIDGWRTTGTAEGTSFQDLKLGFTVDWGGGDRMTFAGNATPAASADPNAYLGGTCIEYEAGAIKQQGKWSAQRNQRFGSFALAGTFSGRPLALDTKEGRGEVWWPSLTESLVGVTHTSLERRVELFIGMKDGQPAGEYLVVPSSPAQGQLTATLRVDEETASRSPDAVAATGGKITIQSFAEHLLTGRVELTFPGGEQVTGSFSDVPTK